MKPNSRRRTGRVSPRSVKIKKIGVPLTAMLDADGVLTQPYLPNASLLTMPCPTPTPNQTLPCSCTTTSISIPRASVRVGGMPSAACSARRRHEKESRELHDGRDCGCWKGATRPTAMGPGKTAGRLSLNLTLRSRMGGSTCVLLPSNSTAKRLRVCGN